MKEERKIKNQGVWKISVKEAQVYPVFDSGTCDIWKKRNTLHKWKKLTIDARTSIKNILIYFLEPIPKNFGHSLGGYSHRECWACTWWYLFLSTEAKKVKEQSESSITPIGSDIFINLSNSNILYSETVKQGYDIWSSSCIIAIKTRMPWFITKVRPRDPSCEARYTHIDAFCGYVSMSTMRKKILVDALGTLRTTRIHYL
jgi:hypothetical protein